MLRWFRNRRLDEEGRRRLSIALARAEETLVETHVRNVLDVYDSVSDWLTLRGVVDLYLDALDVEEPRASIVARRVLARGDRGPAKPRLRARGGRSQ